jgi:hypothetical protein
MDQNNQGATVSKPPFISMRSYHDLAKRFLAFTSFPAR